MFFSEEKNQKTFVSAARLVLQAGRVARNRRTSAANAANVQIISRAR
jgi:hypothetical protein